MSLPRADVGGQALQVRHPLGAADHCPLADPAPLVAGHSFRLQTEQKGASTFPEHCPEVISPGSTAVTRPRRGKLAFPPSPDRQGGQREREGEWITLLLPGPHAKGASCPSSASLAPPTDATMSSRDNST